MLVTSIFCGGGSGGGGGGSTDLLGSASFSDNSPSKINEDSMDRTRLSHFFGDSYFGGSHGNQSDARRTMPRVVGKVSGLCYSTNMPSSAHNLSRGTPVMRTIRSDFGDGGGGGGGGSGGGSGEPQYIRPEMFYNASDGRNDGGGSGGDNGGASGGAGGGGAADGGQRTARTGRRIVEGNYFPPVSGQSTESDESSSDSSDSRTSGEFVDATESADLDGGDDGGGGGGGGERIALSRRNRPGPLDLSGATSPDRINTSTV